ncbi:MAG: ABC transporter ATP-binding protein/permease [Puniceicoccales bacterium]|nr:ABC transporter ATP-binding protein/permease [Puniceicoccales bacterium]
MNPLLRFLWSWLRPYRWIAIFGIILTIPVGSMEAVIAAFLRPFVDQIAHGGSAHFAVSIPLLIVLFTATQGCFVFCAAYVNAWVGNCMVRDVKRKLFQHLLLMDSAYFDTSDSGSVLLRFSTDANTAFGAMMTHVRCFLTRFVSSIALATVLLYTSWWLAVMALSAVCVAFFPLRIVRKKMRALAKKSQLTSAEEMAFYGECCGGNRTIATYNLQERQNRCHAELVDSLFRTDMRLVRHANWPSPIMHFIISIGLAGVLSIGGLFITNELMSAGEFASFVAALLLLYNPIKGIGGNFTAIQTSIVAAERIRETMRMRPKIPAEPFAPVSAISVSEGIAFESISFSYREECPVLNDVSFFVRAGQTVGIVGNSGSGKSTLVHLLLRLYDVQRGRITIDGRDLRQIPIGDLRQSIAVVFQNDFLFSGSIRENILLGRQNASSEDLTKAVEAAMLTTFIESLPQGLDTEVGERGVLLSGGQKQRIAIARAILKDAPIVLLDEATSALDNCTEAQVQRALENLTRNKTVIVIAHRLSTIARADFLVVLESGRITECGTHSELLRKDNGMYSRLHAQQPLVPDCAERL